METASNAEVGDDSIERTDTGRVTWLISATVSLGGFLFGTLLHSHFLFSKRYHANQCSRI